jgi:hypothetical protein
VRQRQATVTSPPVEKQIQQLPSPTTTARGTPDFYDFPDLAEQQLFQESSAASQHMTPGGWHSDKNPDENPDEDTITHALYVPD